MNIWSILVDICLIFFSILELENMEMLSFSKKDKKEAEGRLGHDINKSQR